MGDSEPPFLIGPQETHNDLSSPLCYVDPSVGRRRVRAFYGRARRVAFHSRLRPTLKGSSAILLRACGAKTLPEGIVKSNGRIEATQVDVSSKYAGRLAEVTVEEGSSVTKGK